jgi:hypothetical protein
MKRSIGFSPVVVSALSATKLHFLREKDFARTAGPDIGEKPIRSITLAVPKQNEAPKYDN